MNLNAPVGNISHSQLLDRCIALAKLKPDFIAAYEALLESESVELYREWRQRLTNELLIDIDNDDILFNVRLLAG